MSSHTRSFSLRAWLAYATLAVLLVIPVGVVGPAWADPGDGGRNHNDPGPGSCGHIHHWANTSECTAEGAACSTGGGQAGTCQWLSQQCYCIVSDGGPTVRDGGVIIKDPEPHDQVLGRR